MSIYIHIYIYIYTDFLMGLIPCLFWRFETPLGVSRNGLARPNFQAVSDVQIRLGENEAQGMAGARGFSGMVND